MFLLGLELAGEKAIAQFVSVRATVDSGSASGLGPLAVRPARRREKADSFLVIAILEGACPVVAEGTRCGQRPERPRRFGRSARPVCGRRVRSGRGVARV